MTVVVGVVVDVRVMAVVPAGTVDVVVVGVVVDGRTWGTNETVVGRHGPHECGTGMASLEPQVGGGTVDVAVGE